MPLIEPSTYRAPRLLRGPHRMTLFPNLIRRLPEPAYIRERLELEDGDFLLLDWLRTGSERLAVLSHGLGGHTRRAYMLGMAHALTGAGWDVLTWNFRAAGGEPNRLPRFTHNGSTGDLAAVIRRGAQEEYERIDLVGFSMGGNLTLLHLARDQVEPRVGRGVVLSVPCDLTASAPVLEKRSNGIYMRRFLRLLGEIIHAQAELHPDRISAEGYQRIRTFREFDQRYTAPLHGFADAEDYWSRCSSLPHLADLQRPVLMITALDDPFMAPSCYPRELARSSHRLSLETPRHGGHVGFVSFGSGGLYWSERRTVEFLSGRPQGR